MSWPLPLLAMAPIHHTSREVAGLVLVFDRMDLRMSLFVSRAGSLLSFTRSMFHEVQSIFSRILPGRT